MNIAFGRTLIGVLALALIAVPTGSAVAAATDDRTSGGVVGERGDGIVRLRGTHHAGDLVRHRDGSRAVPFVAYPSEAADGSPSAPAGGFDWSDAGIGAAVGLLGATILAGALIVARGGSVPLRGR
jgi:hypothetical protein